MLRIKFNFSSYNGTEICRQQFVIDVEIPARVTRFFVSLLLNVVAKWRQFTGHS